MNAGLPGTGLGGLFYIVSAIFMPLHRTFRGGGHSGRTWRRVAAQLGIALGILAGLFATGWGLGLVLRSNPAGLVAGGVSPVAPGIGILRWVALLGTVGLLTLLLITVEVAGLALRRRGLRPRRPSTRARHARIQSIRRRRSSAADRDVPRVA